MQSNPSTPDRTRGIPAILFGTLGILYFIILAAIITYIWVFAQDRFVTSASYKIIRQNPGSGESGFAQLGLTGITDTGSSDSQIAIGYVNSVDLLISLEQKFNLREHYASPQKDTVFRLEKDAPLEKRLKFYRNRIYSHYDKETGLTMLTVDTFDPQLSKNIADAVLKKTETFINALNKNVADQLLAFIHGELERSETQVREATLELLELQNTHNLVAPDETITATLKGVEELRMQRLRTETTLASLQRDSPDSPRIETLNSRLHSLDEQITVESAKISGPEQDQLNQILARYKELEIKLEFANNLRLGSESLFEKHRVDAMSNSRFISVIQHPFLPEDVGYPERPYATATILGLGILLFLILRVLVHSIYERVR